MNAVGNSKPADHKHAGQGPTLERLNPRSGSGPRDPFAATIGPSAARCPRPAPALAPARTAREHAWDIYFVFAAGGEWHDTPPMPDDWQHQLGRDERSLDGDKLRESIISIMKQ